MGSSSGLQGSYSSDLHPSSLFDFYTFLARKNRSLGKVTITPNTRLFQKLTWRVPSSKDITLKNKND